MVKKEQIDRGTSTERGTACRRLLPSELCRQYRIGDSAGEQSSGVEQGEITSS